VVWVQVLAVVTGLVYTCAGLLLLFAA